MQNNNRFGLLGPALTGISAGLLSQGFTEAPQTGFEGLGKGLGLAQQFQQAAQQQQLRQQAVQQQMAQNKITNQAAQDRLAIARDKADQGPALQRLLEAAGINPGTPDFRSSVLSSIKRGTTVNITNKGQSEFAKRLGENNAKDFITRRTAALDAVKSLQATKEARELLSGGVITGTGADYLVGAGKALQQLGFNFAQDAVANTEAFAATRAQEVGRIIKLFGAGTGLSDADREFATKAAAGQITMNETSIRRILEINERASQNIIDRFNQDASKINKNLSPFPLTVGPGTFGGGHPAPTGRVRTFNSATGKLE